MEGALASARKETTSNSKTPVRRIGRHFVFTFGGGVGVPSEGCCSEPITQLSPRQFGLAAEGVARGEKKESDIGSRVLVLLGKEAEEALFCTTETSTQAHESHREVPRGRRRLGRKGSIQRTGV